MTLSLPRGVEINAPILPGFDAVLTLPALELVARLHRAFEPRRQQLLETNSTSLAARSSAAVPSA